MKSLFFIAVIAAVIFIGGNALASGEKAIKGHHADLIKASEY